jgi:hypothetical protein
VKYYENLKLVIEIQSRLKDWTEQDSSVPAKRADAGGNQTKGAPANNAGRSERK